MQKNLWVLSTAWINSAYKDLLKRSKKGERIQHFSAKQKMALLFLCLVSALYPASIAARVVISYNTMLKCIDCVGGCNQGVEVSLHLGVCDAAANDSTETRGAEAQFQGLNLKYELWARLVSSPLLLLPQSTHSRHDQWGHSQDKRP